MDNKFRRYLYSNGYSLVRELPDNRYLATIKYLFNWRLVLGRVGDYNGYEDCWCYRDVEEVTRALMEWNGQGEPVGWIKHPMSGRYVEKGYQVEAS